VSSKGGYFERDWFKAANEVPLLSRTIRFWDLAATEPPAAGGRAKNKRDPDWTVGTKIGLSAWGQYVLLDQVALRGNPPAVEQAVKSTAVSDTPEVEQWFECEGGASGKTLIDGWRRGMLKGYPVFDVPAVTMGSKDARIKPVSAAAFNGNVYYVPGQWNVALFDECELWPHVIHDDRIDSTAGGVYVLNNLAPMAGATATVW
jgi:predicted phage terminase large subunit-like protein